MLLVSFIKNEKCVKIYKTFFHLLKSDRKHNLLTKMKKRSMQIYFNNEKYSSILCISSCKQFYNKTVFTVIYSSTTYCCVNDV